MESVEEAVSVSAVSTLLYLTAQQELEDRVRIFNSLKQVKEQLKKEGEKKRVAPVGVQHHLLLLFPQRKSLKKQ